MWLWVQVYHLTITSLNFNKLHRKTKTFYHEILELEVIADFCENVIMVVKKFIEKGLLIEETANRMDVPIDYVKSCLK